MAASTARGATLYLPSTGTTIPRRSRAGLQSFGVMISTSITSLLPSGFAGEAAAT